MGNWYVTGDTHRYFKRFKNLDKDKSLNIVILGDVGLNFYLNTKDQWEKKHLVKEYPNFTFYCVRGNHEERPQNVPGMELIYDDTVCGEVYMEKEFPSIKYFKDWGIYDIDGYSTLVIGGAYSVDKQYRLMMDMPWFPQEQLSEEEMTQCDKEIKGKSFDFVLTHTCPYSWRPEDLFFGSIDQSQVDTTMEKWLNFVKYDINWYCWLFGHYHEDRFERPHVEMFMEEIESFDDIYNRWKNFDKTEELNWWMCKSPNFYMKDVWPKKEEE